MNGKRKVEKPEVHLETVSTTVQRDLDGSVGFVIGFSSDRLADKAVVVRSVKSDDTKLRVGDRILSVIFFTVLFLFYFS